MARKAKGPMTVDVTVEGLDALLAAHEEAAKIAVHTTMAEAGERMKQQWRRQVLSAGMGQRLANTVRSQVYPSKKPSMNAASLTWTNAQTIMDMHDTGGVIRARNKLWLAFPTEAVKRNEYGGKITPEIWQWHHPDMKLVFVPRPNRAGLLVAEGKLDKKGYVRRDRSKTGRGRMTIPIFILVQQVTLRKVLDIDAVFRDGYASVPDGIVATWGKIEHDWTGGSA